MGRIVVVGGGAAGFFTAIACAQAAPLHEVILLEAGRQFLTKVRISGGGRCNVTHACFDPRALAERYPRGGRALIAPFHRFGPRETIAWFGERGVSLKTETDGRMFPITDSSETIVECLLRAAEEAGVRLRTGCGVSLVRAEEPYGFSLTLTSGEVMDCDRLCVAIGGCRTLAAGRWLEALGHTIEPPVPSLFTFHIEEPWLRALPGVSVADVEVSAVKRRERGPLLVTHWGLSGPAVLRLSAWGARALQELDYRFPLRVNWLPDATMESVLGDFQARRISQPGKTVVKTPLAPLPSRLWEVIALDCGIGPEVRWTTLSREAARTLAERLVRSELPVTGKSLNKDEFVTCGGVSLREVDFKTMESRVRPGLYFSGEVLDLDGITGGFNFQAAWTTGWIAGHAMADS